MFALHGSSQGDDFVGVQVCVRGALEEILDQRANLGNAGGAADQHDFVNLLRLELGVFQGLFAGSDGAIQDGLGQLLKLLAG